MVGLRPAPLRPLAAAEILDGAVRLVRRNFRATLAVVVPFAIVRAGLGAWLAYATVESRDASTIGAGGTVLLDTLFGTLLAGLLSPLFIGDLLGTPVSAQESLRRVGGRIWPLIGLSVVVMVAEAAGLAACGVGGFWLWGVWAVAAPALVLERVGLRRALGRSMELVRRSFWRTFGIRALGWVLRSVLGLLITLPFDALALFLTSRNLLDTKSGVDHPLLYVTVLAISGILSAALLLPIGAAVDVMIYTDLRMRREGMDIVLAMPPASPTPRTGQPAAAW